MDLSVNLAGLRLKNPILTASGTFGYGLEFTPYGDLKALGGIVVKGLSWEPREGNPMPRIAETPCGMLNAIGLANVGLDRFLKEKLPLLEKMPCPVVVNVRAEAVEEPDRFRDLLIAQVTGSVRWRESVEWMDRAGVTDYWEVGAGKALSGMIKRIAAGAATRAIGSPEDVAAAKG